MAEEQNKPAGAPESGAAPEAVVADEAAVAKAKKKKMLILISAAVAVIGIVIAVLVVFVFGGKKEHETETEHAVAVTVYDVPPMNVNLLGEDDSPHYLKAKIALELSKAEDIPALEAQLARIQDDWQSFLRQMRVEDFRGSAAIERIKNNLLLRVRQVVAPLEVNNVLLREILVQ